MLDLDKLTDALVAQTMKAINSSTALLIERIDALEKQLGAVIERPVGMTEEKFTKQLEAVEARATVAASEVAKAMLDAVDLPEAPELPDIGAMVSEAVAEAVAALPAPEPGQDGKGVAIDDVAPLIAEAVEKAVKEIPPAKDGIGLAGAMIDRDGNLVVTLTNGETKQLGPVVGKDAEPAQPGRDGLGFEDLEFITDDDGRPVAKFQRGDIVKSIALPCIIDRGPYRATEAYQKGDAVSYGGSMWIAQEDTTEKPDGGKGWRLAVKKGRDGRDTEAKKVGGR